jgi:hypothetical protein
LDDVDYPPEQQLAFTRQLGEDWRELAIIIGIRQDDVRRFARGHEAAAIWEWLWNRGLLGRLPGALREIHREDLADKLHPIAAAEPPHPRRRRNGWNWAVAACSPILALPVILSTPALPYRLAKPFSMILLPVSAASVLWVVHNLRRWRANPTRARWHAVLAAVTAVVVWTGALIATTIPLEETGHGVAHCPVGLLGYGYGRVWIKIAPTVTNTPHEVVVRWGGWTGRPDPVELHETTYFTALKRDWRSGPMDVLVHPAATITCGAGAPPPDRPTIHIDGSKWTLEPAAPVLNTSPTASAGSSQPGAAQATPSSTDRKSTPSVGSELIGTWTGLTDDVDSAAEYPVTMTFKTVGGLVSGESQYTSKGCKKKITIVRQEDKYTFHIREDLLYMPADGSCSEVQTSILIIDGNTINLSYFRAGYTGVVTATSVLTRSHE